MLNCEDCGCPIADGEDCPSCLLYSAARVAQHAAAAYIAKKLYPKCKPTSAWLNEYGVGVDLGKTVAMICGPKVSGVFCGLTGRTRKVKFKDGTMRMPAPQGSPPFKAKQKGRG